MTGAAELARQLDRDAIDLVDAFRAKGGKVSFSTGTYMAAGCGLRVTCTEGAYQAVRRWIDRALA